MSKSRMALRVVLVLMTIGVVVIGYYQWAKSRPDFYLGRAERAVERDDFEAARIDLVRLLSRHPDHAEGHAMLSRVILQEARANNQPASYSMQPEAVQHLARAVELRPADRDLQRQLLRAYLDMRYYANAAVVAEEVYKFDKSNGDAHFALTWRAVDAKDHELAEKLFAETAGVVSRRVFHELAVKMMHYADRQDSERLGGVIRDTFQAAAGLSVDDLTLLVRRDRDVMLQLLLYCQTITNNSETAIQVSRLIIELCEKLANDKLLDDQSLAKYSGQSQTALDKGLGSKPLNEHQRRLREQLADRAGDLGEKAVQSANGASAAVVYWSTARGLLSEGKRGEALAVIEKGIADWDQVQTNDQPNGDVEPSEEQLHLHLLAARLLIVNQRHADVKAHLEILDDQEEYQGWAHLLRGQLLLHDGHFEDARDELKRAQQTLGQRIELSASLARAYHHLQQWELAIHYLESMLVPTDQLSEDEKVWRQSFLDQRDRVHFELLRARLKLDQWKEAQPQLLALRDTELAPQAWYLTIDYLWQRKQQAKARNYLRRSREVFPDDIDLLFLEAKFLQEDGRQSSAEGLFDDFVAASPNDPVRRLAQARWLIVEGSPDKALRVLTTLERHPDLTRNAQNTLTVLRVQALTQAGQYDDAASAANQLIAQPATGAAGYLLKAAIAWKRGDNGLGAELLAKARAAEPSAMGPSGQTLRVVAPNGEVVSVAIQDTYYW